MKSKQIDLKRRALFVGGIFSAGLVSSGAVAKENCSGQHIEVYRSSGKWRWRLFAKNGEQIAEHSQPYDSKDKCLKGIDSVKRAFRSRDLDIKENCN